MAKLLRVLRKKRLLLLIFLALALLTAVVLLTGRSQRGPDLRTLEGRQLYLQELGWEIDLGSEQHKTVRIPTSLDGVIAEYNKMQLEQGCDLSRYLGQSCEQYSYTVTNYPDESQTVLVTLYIRDGSMIAGDIHSTALHGFMQGLRRE